MITDTTLNRKVAPKLNRIEQVTIPTAHQVELQNSSGCYLFEGGSEDIVKIEWLFPAGKRFEAKNITAFATSKLLIEGSAKRSSLEIAEQLDFYGATLRTASSFDFASVTLFCLTKTLPKVIGIVEEMLTSPSFPEQELELLRQIGKQKIQISNQKTGDEARKIFMEKLYGSSHTYGRREQPEHYDALQLADLKKHFKQHYSVKPYVFVSGKNTTQAHNILQAMQLNGTKEWQPDVLQAAEPTNNLKVKKVFEKAVQSSIRIGKNHLDKKHDDFVPFMILNTILGGYFGSRLMSNIREDKGYTYGIYSSMRSLKDGGYFSIGTDVGSNVTEAALKEIYFEIERLINEPVPSDELELVRNYMMGSILSGLDGPFNISDAFKGLMLYGLNLDYYKKTTDKINAIQPKEIQDLAAKYLQPESMFEIIVGS